MQKAFQCPEPPAAGTFDVQVSGRDIGEHFAALLGPCDQNVQPFFAAFVV
jgi:hypothetical protein